MSQDQLPKASASTSSRPTAVSLACENLLELGKNLTKELGLDESNDTLGRWMAHHIAGLIQEAEEANPDERPEKMRVCREAILDLWRHRHIKQHGKSPFDQLEPILKVLTGLDPDNEAHRYFRSIRSNIGKVDVDEETREWLQRADELDHAARLLVGFFISRAARSAVNQSMAWVQMAEKAGVDDDTEHEIYRVLDRRIGQTEPPSDDERKRNQLNRHLERLEEFAEATLDLVDTLCDQDLQRDDAKSQPASES